MEYYDAHPTLETIELFILGRMHHQDQGTLTHHLGSCSPCQTMTAKLQEQIDLIRESMLMDA